MSADSFIDYLSNLTFLSPAFKEEVKDILTEERYKNRQIIVGEGQTENRLWFLKTGLARSYIYDEQGQQYTLRFWKADEVIFSYAGFLKEPSKEYIELLAESELYSITYAKVEELMVNYTEAAKIIGIFNRNYLQKEYQRSHLYALKTKERYKLFRKEYPDIFSMVPLWVIASYLQMTRENLSRIISEQ